MRRDGIPYVPNVGAPTRLPPLEEMDLQTIVRTRLRNCVKCNGQISLCRDCENKCADGKRALELYFGEINIQPMSVHPTKTAILDRARELKENAEKLKQETVVQPPAPKKKRQADTEWYPQAMEQSDPIAWVMEKFNISKTQAKKKIYMYRYNHKESLPDNSEPKEKSEPKQEMKAMEKARDVSTVEAEEESFVATLRRKIETLQQEREEYKRQADKWMALYNGAEEKVTALNMALEAFSV